jgi:protein-S-isoprenylcysteine O-methyltransferase Ste14
VFERRTKGIEKGVRRIDAVEKVLLVFVAVGNFILPVLYLFTPFLAFADYRLPAFVPWCGSATMVAALWLFWRSHSDLGLNWSAFLEMRKDHQLIRQGVYRSIRHPMYVSIFLFGVAQALMLQNWVAGLSGLVTFVPLYLVRTPREERMMREWFGEEYQDYVRQTGRIIPRLK